MPRPTLGWWSVGMLSFAMLSSGPTRADDKPPNAREQLRARAAEKANSGANGGGSRSNAQPTRPNPQPTRPNPQPTQPNPQPTRPNPQPTRPNPQPTRPIPQPTRPNPQPTRQIDPQPRPDNRPNIAPNNGQNSRDRLPTAPRNDTRPDAGGGLRDRLPQGSGTPTAPGNLKDRTETRKPNLDTNQPGSNLRDRLREPQPGQTNPGQNVPGNLRDRLPQDNSRPDMKQPDRNRQPENIRDRLPDNVRDRLPGATDRPREPGSRLPGSENRPGDRLPENVRDRLPGNENRPGENRPTDRLPDNLRDRLPDNARDRLNPADRNDNRMNGRDDRQDDRRDDRGDNRMDRRDDNRTDRRDDRGDNRGDRRDDRPNVVRVDRNGNLSGLQDFRKNADHQDRIRNSKDLERTLGRFGETPELQARLKNTRLTVNDFSGAFQANVHGNTFNRLVDTRFGRQFQLNQQFRLYDRGDIARQLNFGQSLVRRGGWSQRYVGPVYAGYTRSAFSSWYPGPFWGPRYAWTPVWSPWLSWCYWDYALPIYDPRPFIVRPIYYPVAPIVTFQDYSYPAWEPLPVVTCGTWVDVPVTTATDDDLQLLAVRFVDPGHKEEDLGPRYRVWIRNNSNHDLASPFVVTLAASNGESLSGTISQASVSVDSIEAEGTTAVDIRLPYEANVMNVIDSGHRTPFATLHVIVDSREELPEVSEENNGASIARADILPVDPAAFSTDVLSAAPGDLVTLAGEGLGPEPGKVLLVWKDREVETEIYGWYDLGIHFKLPGIPVNDREPVQLVVIRGDGAASNPVTFEMAPERVLSAAPVPSPQ